MNRKTEIIYQLVQQKKHIYKCIRNLKKKGEIMMQDGYFNKKINDTISRQIYRKEKR